MEGTFRGNDKTTVNPCHIELLLADPGEARGFSFLKKRHIKDIFLTYLKETFHLKTKKRKLKVFFLINMQPVQSSKAILGRVYSIFLLLHDLQI